MPRPWSSSETAKATSAVDGSRSRAQLASHGTAAVVSEGADERAGLVPVGVEERLDEPAISRRAPWKRRWRLRWDSRSKKATSASASEASGGRSRRSCRPGGSRRRAARQPTSTLRSHDDAEATHMELRSQRHAHNVARPKGAAAGDGKAEAPISGRADGGRRPGGECDRSGRR